MRNVDYIVVGLGIAGISFCEQLERANKTFIVIDGGEKGATFKSGGILNPTILKRFTAAWNASIFYPVAAEFYQEISNKLQIEILQETPILRILNNPEEQNNWAVASEKVSLRDYLQPQLIKNSNLHISAPFGFGKVIGTSKIQKDKLLNSYRNYLNLKGCLLEEKLEYGQLQIESQNVVYKEISSKKIVFCDGAGALKNPFFPKEAIIPNKGEYLVISAPDLKLDEMLKGPFYIIPLGDDQYRVGATYVRQETSIVPTLDARDEIQSKLKRMISCSFEVLDQTAGVRPTTRDRKPLLGSLENNSSLVFFNGLGSHGFLMAPYLSKLLYENLEKGPSIPSEMDIKRVI